jgi:hypothetical protein
MQPQPYEIVTRRITVFNGQLAEIAPDVPADLRTWTRHVAQTEWFQSPIAALWRISAHRVSMAGVWSARERLRQTGGGAEQLPGSTLLGRLLYIAIV